MSAVLALETDTAPDTVRATPAALRARLAACEVNGLLAQAESLAQLCRDHGHPARVVVGRKRGTVRIKAAYVCGGWMTAYLPVNRAAVRTWLGY